MWGFPHCSIADKSTTILVIYSDEFSLKRRQLHTFRVHLLVYTMSPTMRAVGMSSQSLSPYTTS